MLVKGYKTSNTNRAVLYVKGEYAFKSYYYDTPQEIPDPVLRSEHNSFIKFQSYSPGSVTVDWGDGTKDTYQLQTNGGGYYQIGWRSQEVDYYKNPTTTDKGWGFGRDAETGEWIIPQPNHKFVDGSTEERTITFTFTMENVYYFRTDTIVMYGFPILELSNLKSLTMSTSRYIKEIPFVRLSKIKNLETLSLKSLGDRYLTIPQSIFDMKQLKSLNISSIFDLSNIESTNLRRISELKSLVSFDCQNNRLPKYIKEFNDLPNLTTLKITNASGGIDGVPSFDEVTEINQNMTSFYVLDAGFTGAGQRTTWLEEQLSGKGLQNLTTWSVIYQNNITLNLPEYLKEMNSLSTLSIYNSLKSQDRADTFVNNFYEYMTGWSEVTMTNKLVNGKRNQFYGLHVIMYVKTYPYDYRPSGTFQAPDGFVKGVNNGNPTTPMEKIYVMQNNYAHTWTVKPA